MAITFEINGNWNGLRNALDQSKKAFSDTAKAVEAEGVSMEAVFERMKSAAVGLTAAFSAKEFIRNMVQVRGQFQQLEVAFTTMMGSAEKADALMGQLVKTAATTPFDLQGVAAGAKSLMAYGTAAENVNEMLVRLGDIAAGMSIPLNDLVYLYGTTMNQGRMFTQDLRQFQGRGIPIAEELAKVMNVTKEAIPQLVTAGKVTSDVFHKAIVSMTEEGSRFGGLMEAQSKTITGQISNIEDAVDMMFNDLGKKSEGVINTALGGISTLVENYETIGKIIISVASAYGAYKGALLAVVAVQKAMNVAGSVSAFLSLAKSVTTAKDAMALFNLVTKANPIGLVVSAVAAAATAFALFGDSTSDAERAERRFGESATKATANVKALYATLDTASKTSKIASDTAKELKRVAEEYGVSLSDEAKKLGNEAKLVEELTGKREELIDAIRREAIERERASQQKEIEDDYAKSIQDAREKFVKSLSDDFSPQAKGMMSQLITDEDLERVGRVEAEIRRLRITHGEYSVEVANAERDRAAMTDELVRRLWDYSVQLGRVEGDEAKYAGAASDMKDALVGFLRATNDSTAAQEAARVALAQVTLATTRQVAVQDAASTSADALHSRTASLIDLWNNAHPEMTFKVHFDDSEIPVWMKGMTTEELKKSLAARQQAMASGMDVRYGGRTFSAGDRNTAREAAMMDSIIQGRERPAPKPLAQPPTSDKPKKTPKKTGKTSSWNQAHANADAKEMLENWKDDLADLISDVQQDISDAEVEILDESTEKTLKKLDEDEKKELAAIAKQREDLIEKRRELDKKLWEKSAEKNDQYNFAPKTDEEYLRLIEAEAPGLLGALEKRSKQVTDAITKQRNEILKEQAKQEREARLSYLKEYGDMEQRRLAITEETERKIAEARKSGKSAYEIASIRMEGESRLRELDTKALEERIDWGGVFSSLEGHTKQYLEGLRDQLQAILGTGNLPIDQMAVVQEKLREINAAISEQGTMFSFVGERARENNRLQQEATDAQAELAAAIKEQADAEAALSLARLGAERGKNSEEDVITAEAKLAEAREKTAKATSKAKAAEDASARTNAQKIADTFKNAAEWVNSYLGNLPDLLGKLGLGSAGEKAQMGIDAVNDAAGAAADFASGNYVGAALKAFNALDNLGNIVGAGGLSDKNLEADIERLTQSNENLQRAIDALADQMEDASVLDVRDIYEQQKRMLEQTAAQTREMMQRSGAAYNSGFWGTGIGGSGSSNKRINQALSASDWAMVSKAAGKTIRDAAGFWTLSSKEMYQVMRDANAQWTVIMDKANDGTADAAKFMNDYIELWKRQEELENAYKERWTNVSFDSVKDSFLSALSDMDRSASDFSKDFTKYLFDAVMNAQVGEMLDKELKGWYDNFSKYMESGAGELTDAEIRLLREQWDAIVREGVAMRDNISRATGYGSSSEGSATYNAAKSFTQEQGDILNGRLTAIQIAVRENNVIGRQIAAVLTNIAATGSSLSSMDTAVVEIRNMMIHTNSYLEDIARYAKATYRDFGEKMDRIILHTDNL